ncbi:hypothetical protein KUCAC02_003564 [Chaenocephalus aceratus]|uniref:Uncharacterized protein n=1 Tax=Chaenocephalus aceratus TaxID=36190 RepID=A0ACB9WMS2_CHAAC|nr:hypothetical protein KUCAC02_003564 [Chaenocephalus aceratus]
MTAVRSTVNPLYSTYTQLYAPIAIDEDEDGSQDFNVVPISADPAKEAVLIGPVPHVVLTITLSLQIKAEFGRITTISLEQSFMYNLDNYTPTRIALMKAKGGVLGTKLRPFLETLSQKQSIDMRRDSVICSLRLYLGEKQQDIFEAKA